MKFSSQRFVLTILALVALGLWVGGCGGSDSNNNPVNPGGTTGDDFDQATAMAQSAVAGPQGVSLVESMETMADGVALANKSYTYNAAEQQWEFHQVWDQAGYNYDWFLIVQYLDASGQPQQAAEGAASVHHTMNGVADYSMNQSGFLLDYSYTYSYDVTLTGLGSSTMVMTGSGGFDLDYNYTGSGVTQAATYKLDWETQGAGISYPDGGCPAGTIRYNMDPYYTILTFNGSGTAVATMYDSSGAVVAGGGGSYPLSCAK